MLGFRHEDSLSDHEEQREEEEEELIDVEGESEQEVEVEKQKTEESETIEAIAAHVANLSDESNTASLQVVSSSHDHPCHPSTCSFSDPLPPAGPPPRLLPAPVHLLPGGRSEAATL